MRLGGIQRIPVEIESPDLRVIGLPVRRLRNGLCIFSTELRSTIVRCFLLLGITAAGGAQAHVLRESWRNGRDANRRERLPLPFANEEQRSVVPP